MARKDSKVKRKLKGQKGGHVGRKGAWKKATGWFTTTANFFKGLFKDDGDKVPATPDATFHVTAAEVPATATSEDKLAVIPKANAPTRKVNVSGLPEVKCPIDEISLQVLLRIHPRIPDDILNSGNFHLRNVKLSEEDFRRIQYYFDNSKQGWPNMIGIKSILRITRISDLKPNGLESGPRKMLFHGTKMENIGSILNKGLLPSKSHSLSGGLFFADRAVKSLYYCNNYDTTIGNGWLFLCEVFLGRTSQQKEYSTYPPKGFDSIFLSRESVSVPDESGNVTVSDCVWPMGKTTRQSYDYNEYIVYRAEQVKLRYLIHWEKMS